MLGRFLDALASVPARVAAWVGGLSALALAGVGVVVVAGVGAGSYYAYRTYDYVQHDNDFCLSCHLMREPAELFATSAHAGLGCKACHQPTLMTRSQMALSQILENPSEITAHAHVPNELCANCHISGDPDRWRVVAATAGHRVHLESDDPKLQGLQCVECHAASVHAFAPVDASCSQAACHGEMPLVLGTKAEENIACTACHSFLAPVRPAPGVSTAASVEEALMPDGGECLSCHVMRTLVEMPEQDPHEGVCAACHNPHEHRTPAEAVRSCADSGCHTQPQDLSPMHRGMQPGALEDCTHCHVAHDFSVVGTLCIDCHQDLDRGAPPVRPRPRPRAGGGEAIR